MHVSTEMTGCVGLPHLVDKLLEEHDFVSVERTPTPEEAHRMLCASIEEQAKHFRPPASQLRYEALRHAEWQATVRAKAQRRQRSKAAAQIRARNRRPR